jgi:manganese transport protein
MYNVSEIKDAYRFLAPLMGNKLAPILFAVALIASGQSSTLTGTLAGQIIMEGYLNLRVQPWIRRMITRLLAIIPAIVTILYFGEGYTGHLLILSQVVLSFQLGFAVIPLIHFVSDKQKMGSFAIGTLTKCVAWTLAAFIVLLNTKLIISQIIEWLDGSHRLLVQCMVIPLAIGALLLLLFITFRPLLGKFISHKIRSPHKAPNLGNITTKTQYARIAIAVDFSDVDTETIRHALSFCNPQTQILIIHVVETAGAFIMGNETDDYETNLDGEILESYKTFISAQGFDTDMQLGFGNPKKDIPKIVKDFNADILVMGAHGHKMFKDIIFGTTVDNVRHQLTIPVLIVKQ